MRIKTTAPESAWSNGLVERYNVITAVAARKIKDDINCSLVMALAWALICKISLQYMHDFSPNQLVFGRNSIFSSVLTNDLSALEGKRSGHIVNNQSNNLNSLHNA